MLPVCVFAALQFGVLVGEIQSGRAVNDALRGRIAELERALAEAKAETEVGTTASFFF